MKALIYVALCLFVASCSIQQHVHFNEDWSGNVEYKIDLSGLKEMMEAAEDSTGAVDYLNDPELATSLKELEKMEGLSNVQIHQSESGLVSLSYDFATMEALNNSLNSTNVMEGNEKGMETPLFTLKGHTLTYELPTTAAEESEESVTGLEMIEYSLIFSFDKKIKKLKEGEGATLTNEHTMEFKTTMDELLKSDGKSRKFVIILAK